MFATGRTQYHGQALGFIVAEDRATAHAAAKLVKVTYSDIKKPVLTIKESIKQNRVKKVQPVVPKSVPWDSNVDWNTRGIASKVQPKFKLDECMVTRLLLRVV